MVAVHAFTGCELNTVVPENDQELASELNTITFGHYDDDPNVIVPALECALDRIRQATCLPVETSDDGQHWVRQQPKSYMQKLSGRTTGRSWDNLTISILDTLPVPNTCRMLVHEIGEHVLRRSNDHAVSSSNSKLNAVLIESICQVQDCPCQNPEQ